MDQFLGIIIEFIVKLGNTNKQNTISLSRNICSYCVVAMKMKVTREFIGITDVI